MKHLQILTAAVLLFAGTSLAFSEPEWELVWSDEFRGNKIDKKKWSKIERGKPDWSNYMSPDPSLYEVKRGNLILRGKVNPKRKKDPVPYITGGIHTIGKFSFCYGKIEIRAKLDSAQGAWPAFWLLPDIPNRKWPDDGEIDLMEHLNFDNFVYQTVHSSATQKGLGPTKGSTGKIDRDDYNIYGLEWYPDKLVFFVNGNETFTYPRVKALEEQGQWPFTKPFYLLVDMQIEGSWVGKANPQHFPVAMYVDWIRVYRDVSEKGKKSK